MTQRCITYVCLRPDHHRHQAAEPTFTTYKECCAFCPANAAEGHTWSVVPDVTVETLERLGWIPRRGHPPDDTKAAMPEPELAGATR
jgi:hypothetical protein